MRITMTLSNEACQIHGCSSSYIHKIFFSYSRKYCMFDFSVHYCRFHPKQPSDDWNVEKRSSKNSQKNKSNPKEANKPKDDAPKNKTMSKPKDPSFSLKSGQVSLHLSTTVALFVFLGVVYCSCYCAYYLKYKISKWWRRKFGSSSSKTKLGPMEEGKLTWFGTKTNTDNNSQSKVIVTETKNTVTVGTQDSNTSALFNNDERPSDTKGCCRCYKKKKKKKRPNQGYRR